MLSKPAPSWLRNMEGNVGSKTEGRLGGSLRFESGFIFRLFLTLRLSLLGPAPLDSFCNAPSPFRSKAAFLLCRFRGSAGSRFRSALRAGKQLAGFLQLCDFTIDLGKNLSYSHGYPPVDCLEIGWSNLEFPNSRPGGQPLSCAPRYATVSCCDKQKAHQVT